MYQDNPASSACSECQGQYYYQDERNGTACKKCPKLTRRYGSVATDKAKGLGGTYDSAVAFRGFVFALVSKHRTSA